MHDSNVKFVRHFRGLVGFDALPYLLFFYFNNYLVYRLSLVDWPTPQYSVTMVKSYRGRRKIKQRKTKTKTHKQTKKL